MQQVSEPRHTAEKVLLDEDEEELRKVLDLSRQDMEVEDEEADLRRAIQLSMQGKKHTSVVCIQSGETHLIAFFFFSYFLFSISIIIFILLLSCNVVYKTSMKPNSLTINPQKGNSQKAGRRYM